MNIPDYRVEPADYHADFDDLRAIRGAVFVVEQNIPEDIEFDATDPSCFYFVARDNQNQAIGTGRLSPDGKIGRMAVSQNWRGQGVGKALMIALIDKAQRLNLAEVTLAAQTAVTGFYEKFGFTKQGEVFKVADILHQTMHLHLEPASKSSRPDPKPRDAIVEISEFTTLTDALSATQQVISKARKQICIYTPDLEPSVYGQAEILESLKQFAITSGGGNILIIVQDTLAVRTQPHPLIELAQRLPSTFSLRTPEEPADLQYPSAYLINDRDGYLFRQQSSQYRGVWSPNMPARNRQLAEEFDAVWERCRPCTEFRALGM
jgi:predicted GNAT family N-acyltransferase